MLRIGNCNVQLSFYNSFLKYREGYLVEECSASEKSRIPVLIHVCESLG